MLITRNPLTGRMIIHLPLLSNEVSSRLVGPGTEVAPGVRVSGLFPGFAIEEGQQSVSVSSLVLDVY